MLPETLIDQEELKLTSAALSTKEQRANKAIVSPFAIRREINNRSLYEFVKYFWDEVCNDEFKPNWHIPLICEELEKVAHRVINNEPKEYDLIINIPPGMTKTLVCSIMFPVWCWTLDYQLRFITGSYSSDLSLESAEYSRDLLRSQKFKDVYPELSIRADKDTKSNYKIVKKIDDPGGNAHPIILNGGNRYSTSVGSRIMGFHAHIQIIDDPINPKQAASPASLNAANHWHDQTLPTRKTDKKVSVLVLIMQRLHQDDPSGHILAKDDKKIRHICLPGEIKEYKKYISPPEFELKYTDELLDPVRLGWDQLKELETDLGQYGYAGQIGQNPVPPGGGMFHVSEFSIVTEAPPPNHVVRRLRYWDKAGTQGGGAFTAGVKMALLRNGKFLIEDVVHGQWSTEKREEVIRNTAIADGTRCVVWIEQEPGSGGKESAEATIKNLAGFICRAEKPTGDKIFRADPYSVQVNNGNVQLLYGKWNGQFISEYEYFPFGTYKDQVDAGSGAFNKLVGRRPTKRVT